MPASCWCVHHKAVIRYASCHIHMMPRNACVQQRVMTTVAFYALFLPRHGMSLLAADSVSSLKHTSQTPLHLTQLFLHYLAQLLTAVSSRGTGSQHVALFTTLQAALARGALLTSDVRLWLKLVSTPLVGSLCKLLPAFRSRMLGNPRFLMVLAIEEAIGVAAKWSAEKSSRKDKFWKVCSCTCVLLHSPALSISILASMQNVPSIWMAQRSATYGLLVIGHCDIWDGRAVSANP